MTAVPQPVNYQWALNDVAIPNATSPSYETPAVVLANNGARYTVAVSNPAGTIISNPAMLAVTAAVLNPSITKQPSSQAVRPGQKVTFSVEAVGTSPLKYQWRRNGIDIPGGTSSYTIQAADASENGAQFSVVISHGVASTVSAAATLTVYGSPVATLETNDSTGSKTATMAYEISGFDFGRFGQPCLGTFDSACLHIFADSSPINVDGFTVISDNLALVKGVPPAARSLWFQVSWNPPNLLDPDRTAVWELPVQKTSEDNSASVVGSPAFVYIGDIQTISFSSSAFSVFSTVAGPIPMTFNGNQITGTYDSKKKGPKGSNNSCDDQCSRSQRDYGHRAGAARQRLPAADDVVVRCSETNHQRVGAESEAFETCRKLISRILVTSPSHPRPGWPEPVTRLPRHIPS